MRLFIGIFLGPELAAEASRLTAHWDGLPLRLVPPENLHLTLLPPWAGEPEEAERLLAGVRAAALECRLSRVEPGPDPRRPRLIWAAGEAPPQLLELKRKLEQVLNIQPETRSFRAHVTLARFRPEAANLPLTDFHRRIDWRLRAEKFALIRSELRPGGARYTALREFSLD